jgi:hypothetical protein
MPRVPWTPYCFSRCGLSKSTADSVPFRVLAPRFVERLGVVERVLPCVLASVIGSQPDPLEHELIEETDNDRVVMKGSATAHQYAGLRGRRNVAQSILIEI